MADSHDIIVNFSLNGDDGKETTKLSTDLETGLNFSPLGTAQRITKDLYPDEVATALERIAKDLRAIDSSANVTLDHLLIYVVPHIT